MKIDRALLDEIVAHAVADAPNECCGVILARDGVVITVEAMENRAASPFRFDIDGAALIPFVFDADDGSALAAIYHSHTRSPPYPSQTDVNFAAGWPGTEWLIVGISKDAEPLVRSYLIDGDGGTITEVEIEVL